MENIFNDSDHLDHAFSQFTSFQGNEYSINIPLVTNDFYAGKYKEWLNILNPFRGNLVLGSPGSGKTKTIVHNYVKQFIEKGFVTSLYEYKDDYLSQVAFHTLQTNQHVFKKQYGVDATFHAVNFMSPTHSVRCNPFAGNQLLSIIDAQLAAASILCNLNKVWIQQRGDFFVESSITYLASCLWFLKRYTDAQMASKNISTSYCSLPHLIEFALQDYQTVFALLDTLPELYPLIQPLRNCFEEGISTDSFDHIEGILAVTRVGLSRLANHPEMYWIMTGEEPLVDINDSKAPKILSLINHPEHSSAYSVSLALLARQVGHQINRRDDGKKAFIVDELPTIYIDGLDSLLATGRSNKVATCFTMQDVVQLERNYGKHEAKAIFDLPNTLITGACFGPSAARVASRLNEVAEWSTDESASRTKKAKMITEDMLRTMPYGYFAGRVSPSFAGSEGQAKFIAKIPLESTPWLANRRSTILPAHPELEGLTDEQIELRFQENMDLVRNQIGELIRNADNHNNLS
jgi:hypothetical protein